MRQTEVLNFAGKKGHTKTKGTYEKNATQIAYHSPS